MGLLSTPLEILDQILAQTDHEDVLALACLCRALRLPSQRRLYTSIEIRQEQQFAQLYATFSEYNPELVAYVKILQVFHRQPLEGEDYDSSDIHNENRLSLCLIASTSPFLPKVLDILPRIDQFLVHGPTNDHRWSKIPKDTRRALIRLLRRSPNLTLISLPGSVDLPPDFFLQIGRVTGGSLKEVYMQQSWKDTRSAERITMDSSDKCLHPLRSLTVIFEGRPTRSVPPDSDMHPPNWLGPKMGLDTTRLEHLFLQLNETFASAKELLVSPILKTLELAFICAPWAEQPLTGFDLSKLESLTHLTIDCNWSNSQGGPFSWVAYTLQTIALSERQNSNLTLNFSAFVSFMPGDDCLLLVSPFRDALQTLYNKYTGVGCLPELKEVTVTMTLFLPEDSGPEVGLDSLERFIRPIFKSVKPVQAGDLEGVKLHFAGLNSLGHED